MGHLGVEFVEKPTHYDGVRIATLRDPEGNVVPPSYYEMEGDFRLEMMVTVTFEEVASGKTRMTLVHEGLPAGEHREGAAMGWGTSLDKLAAALAEA